MATGRLEPLDPAVEGPDGRTRRWWEIGNGWPVWWCTRCLRTLPATDGGRGVETHLQTCHHASTQDEIRMTSSVLGPEALPPQPHPIPPLIHGTGLPRHMRGRRTQPRPDHSVPTGSDDLALGHGTVGPGHPGTLHPATGPARTGPLVVHAVWYVMAGSASHAHLPGRVCPLDRHAPTGAPKLAAAHAAGNREAVAGLPGPEFGRPGGRGRHDPSHRPPMPGPGVKETVPRVAAQPPQMGGH